MFKCAREQTLEYLIKVITCKCAREQTLEQLIVYTTGWINWFSSINITSAN